MTKSEARIFHARSTGLMLTQVSEAGDPTRARVLFRGETFEVSPAEYEATIDRLGRSWLDLTPEEQVARWGMQKFGTGPAPSDMGLADDDENQMYQAGQRAQIEARAISDAEERKAALQRVNAKYGAALHPVAQSAQHIPSGLI